MIRGFRGPHRPPLSRFGLRGASDGELTGLPRASFPVGVMTQPAGVSLTKL